MTVTGVKWQWKKKKEKQIWNHESNIFRSVQTQSYAYVVSVFIGLALA